MWQYRNWFYLFNKPILTIYYKIYLHTGLCRRAYDHSRCVLPHNEYNDNNTNNNIHSCYLRGRRPCITVLRKYTKYTDFARPRKLKYANIVNYMYNVYTII